MKICWDNLEEIKLSKNGNFRKNDKTSYYHECCGTCGQPFLGEKEGRFCTSKCIPGGKYHKNFGRHHSEECKQRMKDTRVGMYGKTHTTETKNKISSKLKGNTNVSSGAYHHNWKGGVTKNHIPLYDTYVHQLQPYEQCRRNKEDSNVLEVKCTYCGKWYVPDLRKVYNRLQYGINKEDGSRFYCSNSCKQECPVFRRRKHYKEQKHSREVQPQLRQVVFERDGWTCQKCGSLEHLHCHHILPVAIEPIESADMDNCITLCKRCHKEVHKQAGCKYNELKNC